ncbi:MAG: hypothetical protein KBS95_06835, partial [Alistipes sp.]|nr:hypothetical protein [Candidatus Alistipes equi]
NVVLPSSASRASHDGDGDGKFVDRCRLQIWLKDSLCVDRTAPVENSRAEFKDVFIDTNPEYRFLFWADCSEGNFYNTESLRRVTIQGPYQGNDDRRDAFCACASSDEVKASILGTPIMLHRPFAQMNIITTDIGDFIDYSKEGSASLLEEFFPKNVRLRFHSASVFDVYEMKGSEVVETNYTSKIYSDLLSLEGPRNRTLSMDYILALDESKFLADIEFTLTGNAEDTTMNFQSVPLQRNYRTSVMGRLLTVEHEAVVTISSEWNGEQTTSND